MTKRSTGAPTGGAQTVLVVDDHAGFRLRTRRLLERDRFRVVEAADGGAAIRMTATERPDLVLLDIHLPDMDGFEVAAALRDTGAAIPIILISTHPAADVAARLPGSAADGYIDKADLSATTIAAAVAGRT